jgi:hypothetical protein
MLTVMVSSTMGTAESKLTLLCRCVKTVDFDSCWGKKAAALG